MEFGGYLLNVAKKPTRARAQGRSARGPILPKSNRNFRQPPHGFPEKRDHCWKGFFILQHIKSFQGDKLTNISFHRRFTNLQIFAALPVLWIDVFSWAKKYPVDDFFGVRKETAKLLQLSGWGWWMRYTQISYTFFFWGSHILVEVDNILANSSLKMLQEARRWEQLGFCVSYVQGFRGLLDKVSCLKDSVLLIFQPAAVCQIVCDGKIGSWFGIRRISADFPAIFMEAWCFLFGYTNGPTGAISRSKKNV